MRDLSHSDLDVLPQQQPVSWRCRDPHCNVAFASDAERQLHETESHQLNVTEGMTSIDAEIETVSNTDTEDNVLNYYSNFMKMRLLERNFQETAAEMDGERLLRLWKFKFLHFRDAGRTKYALEAFHFQAAQLALLSPHESHKQLWNRGFNLHGGIGKNIPLDMMAERNNQYVKEMISNYGANLLLPNWLAVQLKRYLMCSEIWIHH